MTASLFLVRSTVRFSRFCIVGRAFGRGVDAAALSLTRALRLKRRMTLTVKPCILNRHTLNPRQKPGRLWTIESHLFCSTARGRLNFERTFGSVWSYTAPETPNARPQKSEPPEPEEFKALIWKNFMGASFPNSGVGILETYSSTSTPNVSAGRDLGQRLHAHRCLSARVAVVLSTSCLQDTAFKLCQEKLSPFCYAQLPR